MKSMNERKYWSLQDAATKLRTTPENLIHQAGFGGIQLSLNLFNQVDERAVIRLPIEALLKNLEATAKKSGKSKLIERVSAYREHWQRSSIALPNGVYELMPDDARNLEASVHKTVVLGQAVRFDGSNWLYAIFQSNIVVRSENIVVLSEEIERIKDDRESSLSKPGGNDPRESTANLNLIGMLVRKLQTHGGRYATESAVIDWLLDSEMKLRKETDKPIVYGMSRRSMQEKFLRARESLKSSGVQALKGP
jgi:hypothetical protein